MQFFLGGVGGVEGDTDPNCLGSRAGRFEG